MPPTYPIFSKRAQREQKTKRGAYNFARKEQRAGYNPPPRPEPCDLDIKIPLYDEFHYEEIKYHFPTIQFYDMTTLQKIIAIWPKP